jgi:ribonucleotide monophosphatase NagD (HAD superfamily)
LEVDGFKILEHNGGTAGFSSELKMDKDNKKAVIVLSNVSGLAESTYSNKISELATSLLENISLQ